MISSWLLKQTSYEMNLKNKYLLVRVGDMEVSDLKPLKKL